MTLGISLDVACCRDFADPLYKQLSSGKYNECSVLPIPLIFAEWAAEHRTARKRAARAQKRGYWFDTVDRHAFEDDIWEINTSMEHRQGRQMTDSYRQRPQFGPDDWGCQKHGVHPYGVFHGTGQLVAYLWMYRAGDLALVSSILGHGQHLENEVMYLLFAGALEREIAVGPGVCVYNRHDSGTDGLRFFKERLGFEEQEVAWLL